MVTVPTRLLIIAFVALMCGSPLFTQAEVAQQHGPVNVIYGKVDFRSGLDHFYAKLYQLQKGVPGKVVIVHIGDSHVQADHFPGVLRRLLQQRFGNGGRGLVFPYRVIGTNGPPDYSSESNVKWVYRRNVKSLPPIPIGLSGITMQTESHDAEISLKILPYKDMRYSFTKLVLFHDKSDAAYDVEVFCKRSSEVDMVDSSNNTRVSSIVPGQKYTPDHSLFMSTFIFPELQTEVSIRAKKTNTLQSFFQMYGLLLEEDTNGIIYNTIGVNGAEFRHFNNSDYFQEQLKALQPDLIIVSLGTNDGYVRNFDMNEFYFQAQTFVKTLQASNVAASILLTTPPGVKIRNRRDLKAQNVLLARNAILNLYRPNGVACWDLYGVLKKYRRILTNQKPSADKVHFRKAEYEVQGELLYNVLMDGYKNYISGQRISTTDPKTGNK